MVRGPRSTEFELQKRVLVPNWSQMTFEDKTKNPSDLRRADRI